jgi:hypothetical protein
MSSCSVTPRLMITYGRPRWTAISGIDAAGCTERVDGAERHHQICPFRGGTGSVQIPVAQALAETDGGGLEKPTAQLAGGRFSALAERLQVGLWVRSGVAAHALCLEHGARSSVVPARV